MPWLAASASRNCNWSSKGLKLLNNAKHQNTRKTGKVTIITWSSVFCTVWGSMAPCICSFCIYMATTCFFSCKIGILLQILPQFKFSRNLKFVHHPRTIRHLCAKFDVLGPSQSWDIVCRKTQTDPDTQLISPSMNSVQWRTLNQIFVEESFTLLQTTTEKLFRPIRWINLANQCAYTKENWQIMHTFE